MQGKCLPSGPFSTLLRARRPNATASPLTHTHTERCHGTTCFSHAKDNDPFTEDPLCGNYYTFIISPNLQNKPMAVNDHLYITEEETRAQKD